ncbi:MAG: NADPH-dependent FMN reductase, partial [Kofleriaceae bacterium]
MTTILGISGSLRTGSYNTALLAAATRMAPSGTTIEVASIRGIPLYDGDVEAASGIPPEVVALKDRIASADGVLLV